jgi:hypothetical protein
MLQVNVRYRKGQGLHILPNSPSTGRYVTTASKERDVRLSETRIITNNRLDWSLQVRTEVMWLDGEEYRTGT